MIQRPPRRPGIWPSIAAMVMGLLVVGSAADLRGQLAPQNLRILGPAFDDPFALAGPVQLSAPQLPLVSGSAAARLEQVPALVAAANWDDAIDTLRELANEERDRVVAIDEHRYVSLRTYGRMQIAKLPPAGLARYRQRVDALAERRYRDALAARDEAGLRRVVDEAFCSTWGDDALMTLGELALERADYSAARRYWEQISPQLREPADWLAYPDTNLDLATVRARLVLTSIRAGALERASRELATFRRLHPQAVGRLAGVEGALLPALERLLAASRAWPTSPVSGDWPTFAGSFTRNRIAPAIGPIDGPAWSEAIKLAPVIVPSIQTMITIDGGIRAATAQEPRQPLSYFPVVAGGRLYYADAQQIFAVRLSDGQGAVDDGGVIYRNEGSANDHFQASHVAAVGAAPQHTLTLVGDKLYARLGSPITARVQAIGSSPSDRLVGIDLSREGLLAFRALPEEKQWSFDGVPVSDGRYLYVAVRRSDVNSQAAVACYDPATGGQIWRTSVCSANTPASGRGDESTHNLLSLSGDRIYFNTNLGVIASLRTSDGAICWLHRYERQQEPIAPTANQVPAHGVRVPSPVLIDEGVLYVAPADTPSVFALNADTGRAMWSAEDVADTSHLLGVVDETLIAAGGRLRGIDARSGKVRFTGPPSGAAEIASMGRGVIAGSEVFYPTQKEIYVLDAMTGNQTRAPISLRPVGEAGANLIIADGYLIAAGPERMMAYGSQSNEVVNKP